MYIYSKKFKCFLFQFNQSMTWRTENMDHILENIITDESILKHISVGVVSRYKSGNPGKLNKFIVPIIF